MINKLIFLLILILSSCSCNYALLVNKDNVINIEEGYIQLYSNINDKFVHFVPSKIDTSLTLIENLAKYKLGKGFYIYGVDYKHIKYLKIFGDTIQSGILVPVELQYRKKRSVIHQSKLNEKNFHEELIKLDSVYYSFMLNSPQVYFINATPLLSEEREEFKTREYGD